MKDFSNFFTNDYFNYRNLNNPKRLASFLEEKKFIQKYMPLSGVVCDIGCSTGEFLTSIDWSGLKYGMEINSIAIEKAKNSGIRFDKNILTETDFFDAVIFRGTIQLLPQPFHYISKAYSALKSGGKIVFLATPNINSLVYKIFNTLPALSDEFYFYTPSDITLKNILKKYDFVFKEIEYPYLNSPYAHPIMDHFNFIKSIIFKRTPGFAFWRNMMNVIACKH